MPVSGGLPCHGTSRSVVRSSVMVVAVVIVVSPFPFSFAVQFVSSLAKPGRCPEGGGVMGHSHGAA